MPRFSDMQGCMLNMFDISVAYEEDCFGYAVKPHYNKLESHTKISLLYLKIHQECIFPTCIYCKTILHLLRYNQHFIIYGFVILRFKCSVLFCLRHGYSQLRKLT